MSTGRKFGTQATGGSSGDEALDKSRGGGAMSMFQDGVDYLYTKKDKPIFMRILPARDNSMSVEDTARLGSVVPYRDVASGIMDKGTNSEAFTAWYLTIRANRFFGKNGVSFISPLTMGLFAGATPEDKADPVLDVYRWLKEHGGPGTKYASLTDKDNKNGYFKSPGDAVIMNVCYKDGPTWKNALLMVSKTALADFKETLSLYAARDTKVHDDNFPKYLFGDITDPQSGLVVSTTTKKMDTGNDYVGFAIGDSDKEIVGTQSHPVGQDVLDARYELLSDETLKIPTYQEIVDYMVIDGSVPIEVIEAACGHMATIDHEKAGTLKTKAEYEAEEARRKAQSTQGGSTSLGPQDAAKTETPATPATPAAEAPAAPAKPAAPKPPAPPAKPEAPKPPTPPAPPKAEDVWHVNPAGDVEQVSLDTLRNSSYDGMVMALAEGSDWTPIASFVPTVPAPAAAPVANVADTTAETPAADEQAETPAGESKLTPEEETELADLRARATGSGTALTAEEMLRTVELATRK